MFKLLLPVLLLTCSTAVAQVPSTNECAASLRRSLLALSNGNVSDTSKDFDAELTKTHDESQLRATWNSLLQAAGDFQQVGSFRVSTVEDRTYVITKMVFSKGVVASIGGCDASGRITFYEWSRASDAEEKIAGAKSQTGPGGIRMVPTAVPSKWGPLPAILTLPRGSGPFPGVVLVAGAGPNDEDESLGPNKPFQDLANGLATDGITSLRYDKSIRAYPPEAGLDKTITIDDEVVNDALAALKVLRSTGQVNPRKIFLLGHSLGAMMAPRIAERSSGLAGVIMMGSPFSSILDNGMQQTRYVARIQHLPPADLQKQLDALLQEKALLEQTPPDRNPTGEFMGMPQSWWISLHRYNQVKEAQSLDVPMLIMQGASDFQVSAQDNFTQWQSAFAGNPRVTLLEYPRLSHVFMPSGNPPSPTDYEHPANLDKKVIADISAWIHNQKVRR